MREGKLPGGLKAIVLDMDGVLTQTAKLHRQAWKEMFNDFLNRSPDDYAPMVDEDYYRYLDGKPRYKGVESFLMSRGIDLPFGDPEDEPGLETICGLGNQKNLIYTSLLKEKGADVYESAVAKVKEWRKAGLKIAVVTSSKNCNLVLESAGISNLFDVKVDGNVASELDLNGKPDPDIFCEAVKRLKVSAGNCILFEDAVSGVQAGSNGNFALVIGVARNDNKQELNTNGADMSIVDFDELDLYSDEEIQLHFMENLPPLIYGQVDPVKLMDKKVPVLFFDYDGTLTPIVKHPEDAIMDQDMRDILRQCAARFPVAVISGRDMDDLKNKVDISNLIYAGSHGFRISGRDGLYKEHEKAEEILPKLDKMENQLENELKQIDSNVLIDRKRYAIAVHYRNVKEENVNNVLNHVNQIIESNVGFKIGKGKKVVEIKPDADWHKGKAVHWILEKLEKTDHEKYIPVYIGDDVTDEDAFQALENDGLGILVGAHGEKSSAKYRLKNVYQVKNFLKNLIESELKE